MPHTALAALALAGAPMLGCQGLLEIEDGTLRASGEHCPVAAEARSCWDLPATCGPNGDADCCESCEVPGGTFYRSYDRKTFTDLRYRATVSTFVLDRYEVTVGRFRKFLAAYSQDMTRAGEGRNPNNPTDPGWDTAWNERLPTSDIDLSRDITCKFWQDSGTSANRPMACISWAEAFAFCIWDGGRLPTEAEWNYAAAGGGEQRAYPWSSDALDETYAVGDVSESVGPSDPENVGSRSPKGDGKWGHADLAGNIAEYNVDWYWPSYSFSQMECRDCAATEPDPETESHLRVRVIRGGSFSDDGSQLLSSFRTDVGVCASEGCRSDRGGFRCARDAR